MGAIAVGSVFGRLTVVSAAERAKSWVCVCCCGSITTVHGANLYAGRTSSCGCLWRERVTRHGASGSRTYASWRSMVNRCTKPHDPSFYRYGAVGIAVAPEWLEFSAFLSDMGERPPGLTIDRKDPFGNYCKSNCRWATAKEQARNHRRTHRVIATPKGHMRVCEAAEVSGISENVLRARLRLKWPAQRLFEPVNSRSKDNT